MGGAIRGASLVIALLAGASATPPSPAGSAKNDHASRARVLEELGKTEAAAREYEAAFQETHDAENLYHLAICKRVLGNYSAARDALRGYLREAPDGPFAVEVERQLAHLAVLIEARGLQSPKAATKAPPAKPRRDRARAEKASETAGGARGKTSETSAAPATTFSTAAKTSDTSATALPAAAPLTPSALPLATSRPSASPSAAPVSVAQPREAPGAALPSAQVSLEAPSRWRATPWLAGGAVAMGTAGAVLCVSAHNLSSSLNSSYSAGDLSASDRSRYAKARAEGIAGTALIGAAVIALGAAAVLAW